MRGLKDFSLSKMKSLGSNYPGKSSMAPFRVGFEPTFWRGGVGSDKGLACDLFKSLESKLL